LLPLLAACQRRNENIPAEFANGTFRGGIFIVAAGPRRAIKMPLEYHQSVPIFER
jgi:hypothetical protein